MFVVWCVFLSGEVFFSFIFGLVLIFEGMKCLMCWFIFGRWLFVSLIILVVICIVSLRFRLLSFVLFWCVSLLISLLVRWVMLGW